VLNIVICLYKTLLCSAVLGKSLQEWLAPTEFASSSKRFCCCYWAGISTHCGTYV